MHALARELEDRSRASKHLILSATRAIQKHPATQRYRAIKARYRQGLMGLRPVAEQEPPAIPLSSRGIQRAGPTLAAGDRRAPLPLDRDAAPMYGSAGGRAPGHRRTPPGAPRDK